MTSEKLTNLYNFEMKRQGKNLPNVKNVAIKRTASLMSY